MSRTFSINITKIDAGVKKPDTGHVVTLRDIAGNILGVATETPASSGQYVLVLTETPLFAYWYVDGTIQKYDNNEPFWVGTYDSISASSISSGTLSANLLLAGNFQSSTASLNAHLTGTDSGTGTLQTQVGSLWNSKVPYSGATANVNLVQYSVTAGSLSTLLITFGDGTTQTTAGSGGGGLPYPDGATAGVNLATFGLTASSISSVTVTAQTVSAISILAGNFDSSTASLQNQITAITTTAIPTSLIAYLGL